MNRFWHLTQARQEILLSSPVGPAKKRRGRAVPHDRGKPHVLGTDLSLVSITEFIIS